MPHFSAQYSQKSSPHMMHRTLPNVSGLGCGYCHHPTSDAQRNRQYIAAILSRLWAEPFSAAYRDVHDIPHERGETLSHPEPSQVCANESCSFGRDSKATSNRAKEAANLAAVKVNKENPPFDIG